MAAAKSPAVRWPSPLTASHVYDLIRAESNVHKALLIFDSASGEHSSGYRHDHSTFSLMAGRLAAAGLPRDAESLLYRSLTELGHAPSEPSFLPILRAYSRAHLPLDALRFFRRMSAEFLLQPSHRSYTALISGLVANSRLSLAKTLFGEMKDAGVPFTVASFNVLIKALISSPSSGAVDAALRVFRRMLDQSCPPDTCTYSTLIDGLCRHRRVEDARKLFEEMPQRGCAPTVVTFTCLMHGLCRAGNFDDALKLFDGMCDRGVIPNVVTYSSLIDGLCKGGQSFKAIRLLEQMGKQGCCPNVVTYSALINGLCGEGRLREALEIFDKMRIQGRTPDAGLYGKLIKCLSESNRYQEAANYLDEMVLSGIFPNRLTWSLHVWIHNIVIRGLCSKGDIIRGFQVYLSTRNQGISVEPKTYGLLVDHYSKKGDVHKVARVVDEMVLEGCIPDCTAWTSILGAYWDRRKVREATELLWNELICGNSDLGIPEVTTSLRYA